jgi:hypothetical protein
MQVHLKRWIERSKREIRRKRGETERIGGNKGKKERKETEVFVK